MHASIEFVFCYPVVTARWHAESNVIVLLAVADELVLTKAIEDARSQGMRVVEFHEPDLGGALTAAALEPAAYRLLSPLPLAFAPRKEVRR